MGTRGELSSECAFSFMSLRRNERLIARDRYEPMFIVHEHLYILVEMSTLSLEISAVQNSALVYVYIATICVFAAG